MDAKQLRAMKTFEVDILVQCIDRLRLAHQFVVKSITIQFKTYKKDHLHLIAALIPDQGYHLNVLPKLAFS